MTIRAWGMPLPNIGSMDGNTGRSEGATAEKAVPFPCAVLDPTVRSLNCAYASPRQGLVAFRHLQKPIQDQLGMAYGVLDVLVAPVTTE